MYVGLWESLHSQFVKQNQMFWADEAVVPSLEGWIQLMLGDITSECFFKAAKMKWNMNTFYNLIPQKNPVCYISIHVGYFKSTKFGRFLL